MLISIIIPCFNERRTISEVITRVSIADLGFPAKREILVIDDGSSDGTYDLVQNVKSPYMRVFRHVENQGKGATLRTGIKEAKGEIIIFQDADLEYDPAQYVALLQPFDDVDVDAVYGSRFIGMPNKSISMLTSTVNRYLNAFFNLFFSSHLHDLETGQKAFRSKSLNVLALKSRGFDIEVEIAAKLLKNKMKIIEVPVGYTPRSHIDGKKMSYMKEGLRAVVAVIKHRFF